MRTFMHAARRVGLATIGAATLAAGLALTWYVVRPGAAARIETPALAATLASLVLPGLACGAWYAERHGRS